MVDEYQDVNQKQDALVRTFLEKGISVWVVGDDDQAIFDFQGGDCRYLTNISARDDVESYSLNTNFRCGRAINHIANDVGLKIPRVLDKQIISGSPLQGQVIVETFQSEPIMCQSVVHFIKNELGKIPDFKFSDVAVLDFSPEINLRELVKWFDIHQIPWKYRDNKYPLSDSPPVELLIGAIDWICRNPEVPKVNDKSNSPSKADLEENRHLDILFPQNNPQRKAAVKGLLALHKKFESWTSNAKNVRLESTESLRGDQPLSPEQFGARMFKVLEESHEMAVTSIIEELKIIFSFYQTGHNDSTYMEIEAFDEIVRDFSLICPNGGLHSFYRFLFQFAMGGGRGSKHKSLYFARRAQQYEGDAVLISSLHQAKGLTCEFVFIPRLNEGTQRYELPRLGPRIYDENPLFSKEFRLTTPRRTTPATDIRLFYVGVTRARKLLWLSGLTSKLKRGERQLCRPSRFLSLVKESCAEYKTQS
jgi:superfamily I DNA/RNA helicase